MKLKASDLINYEIKPFLFGVLFSRILPDPIKNNNPDKFYIYSLFKRSKAVLVTDFSFQGYAPELVNQYNFFSGYSNWEIHSVSSGSTNLRFYIYNDLNINASQFYVLVYKKLIANQWLIDEGLNDEKKSFIRGYMETRGSVDLTTPYFSQDYFYNNIIELKRAMFLTSLVGIPISYVNFNPRNMQPQYVSGKNKRNAQLRMNLLFYANKIGFINKYKALVFENTYKPRSKVENSGIIFYDVIVPEITNSIEFLKYLNFFTNNIYNKELTEKKIQALRKLIGFSVSQSSSPTRNRSIIALFEEISDDKCALCDITETFKKRGNGRQSFHIHHMISFHNGEHFDNIANLIKLCPTCHSSLKKGSSPKEEQIKSIIKILHKHPEVFEYTSSVLCIEDIHELAEEIYSRLG